MERVLIEYKDRLARFGYEYLDAIFNNLEIKVEVMETKDKKYEEELAEDIMKILTCYSARYYGARGGRKKKNEQENELCTVYFMFLTIAVTDNFIEPNDIIVTLFFCHVLLPPCYFGSLNKGLTIVSPKVKPLNYQAASGVIVTTAKSSWPSPGSRILILSDGVVALSRAVSILSSPSARTRRA